MDQKTCNSSIHCTVANCAYHAPQNCCSLKSINVGCCDSAPHQLQGHRVCLVPAEVTHQKTGRPEPDGSGLPVFFSLSKNPAGGEVFLV